MVDPDAVGRILLDAYNAALDPEGLIDAIAKLLDVVHAPFGGMPIFWSPYAPEFSIWRGPPPLAAGLPLEHAKNPVLAMAARQPVGIPVRYEEVVTGAESFLRIIHRHMEGLAYTAHINVCVEPDCHSGLVLHRNERFSDDELGLLAGLTSHLRRILSLYRHAHEKKVLEAALLSLDHVGAGIILVDGQHRPVFANSIAERLLRARDGLCLERGRLRAVVADQGSAEFERQLSDAIATGEGRLSGNPRSAWLRRASGGSMRLSVVPLLLQAGTGRMAPRVLLMLTLTSSAALSARDLQDRHGLTFAESRVAVRLARGKSLHAIAMELGVGLTTVRSHLYRSFVKTGSARQAELVALVAGNRA